MGDSLFAGFESLIGSLHGPAVWKGSEIRVPAVAFSHVGDDANLFGHYPIVVNRKSVAHCAWPSEAQTRSEEGIDAGRRARSSGVIPWCVVVMSWFSSFRVRWVAASSVPWHD